DGTFTRQRFYRGARWMEETSQFQVVPTDDAGNAVGPPLTARAGQDDRAVPADDGFVRRFVARQVATGCPAVGDTTGATFTAHGLVQLRDSPHPEQARPIPAAATRLRLEWSEQPATARAGRVSHAPPSDFPFGYRLQV